MNGCGAPAASRGLISQGMTGKLVATVDQPIKLRGGLLFDGVYEDHLTLGSKYIFSDQDGMTILAVANATTNKGAIYSLGAVSGGNNQLVLQFEPHIEFLQLCMEVAILAFLNIDVGRSIMVFQVLEDRQLLRLNGQIMARK